MWVANISFKLLVLALFTIIKSQADKSACEQKEKNLAVLDLAKESISKAKNLQPTCENDSKGTSSNSTECGAKEKVSAYLDIANKLIDEARENYLTCDKVGDHKDEVEKNKDEVGKDKDEVVKDKDEVVKDKDEVVKDKEEVRKDKDEVVKDKDEVGKDKDEVVKDKDEVGKDKDEVGKDKDEVGKDKDEVVKDKDEVVKDKDEVVKDKDEVPPPKKPADCAEILKNGESKSGEYAIYPKNRISNGMDLTVYCDMDTDGGGWTVIQRRGNFPHKLDFYRTWQEYKLGFGNINEEFWIGNDNIYALTNQGNYTARFDMTSSDGQSKYATYSSFRIDDERAGYMLHYDQYSGTAGNGLREPKGMKFSTRDKVNDKSNGNEPCPTTKRGGWWYSFCGMSNPNGVNYGGGRESKSSMNWYPMTKYRSLQSIEIKIRPEK